jgi:hypothetical protein
MNDEGFARPCFENEFHIRSLDPVAAKWSPLLVLEAFSLVMMDSKTAFTFSSRDGEYMAFRTRTPGPERKIWCHSSWRSEIVDGEGEEKLGDERSYVGMFFSIDCARGYVEGSVFWEHSSLNSERDGGLDIEKRREGTFLEPAEGWPMGSVVEPAACGDMADS